MIATKSPALDRRGRPRAARGPRSRPRRRSSTPRGAASIGAATGCSSAEPPPKPPTPPKRAAASAVVRVVPRAVPRSRSPRDGSTTVSPAFRPLRICRRGVALEAGRRPARAARTPLRQDGHRRVASAAVDRRGRDVEDVVVLAGDDVDVRGHAGLQLRVRAVEREGDVVGDDVRARWSRVEAIASTCAASCLSGSASTVTVAGWPTRSFAASVSLKLASTCIPVSCVSVTKPPELEPRAAAPRPDEAATRRRPRSRRPRPACRPLR